VVPFVPQTDTINTKTSTGHGDATSKGGYRGSNEQQLPPATTTTTTAKDTEIRGAQRGTKKPNTICKYTRSNRMQKYKEMVID
jgi:hypothetical protein